MPVERVVTRGKEPGDVIEEHIKHHEAKGKTLVAVIPLQDELIVVWSKPKRETRG